MSNGDLVLCLVTNGIAPISERPRPTIASIFSTPGTFHGAQDIPAPDDREAAKKARQLLDRQDIELWNGERLIARFDHDRPWPKNE